MPDRHPLYYTLEEGVRLAAHNGTTLDDIRPLKWAETYHATEEEVLTAWRKELLKPAPNSVLEDFGDGK